MMPASLSSKDLVDQAVPLVLVVLNTPLLPSFSALWERARHAVAGAVCTSSCSAHGYLHVTRKRSGRTPVEESHFS